MSEEEQLLPEGSKQQTEAQAVKHLIELSRTPRAGRTCALQITNHSRDTELKDPIVVTEEGRVRSPAKKIRRKSEGVLVLTRKAWRRQGTSGLVSYCYATVHEEEHRFVIFWKVPQSGPNMFGICWAAFKRNTSEDMKEEMLKAKLTTFLEPSSDSSDGIKKKEATKGTELEITNKDISLSATMGSTKHAILMAEFCN